MPRKQTPCVKAFKGKQESEKTLKLCENPPTNPNRCKFYSVPNPIKGKPPKKICKNQQQAGKPSKPLIPEGEDKCPGKLQKMTKEQLQKIVSDYYTYTGKFATLRKQDLCEIIRESNNLKDKYKVKYAAYQSNVMINQREGNAGGPVFGKPMLPAAPSTLPYEFAILVPSETAKKQKFSEHVSRIQILNQTQKMLIYFKIYKIMEEEKYAHIDEAAQLLMFFFMGNDVTYSMLKNLFNSDAETMKTLKNSPISVQGHGPTDKDIVKKRG